MFHFIMRHSSTMTHVQITSESNVLKISPSTIAPSIRSAPIFRVRTGNACRISIEGNVYAMSDGKAITVRRISTNANGEIIAPKSIAHARIKSMAIIRVNVSKVSRGYSKSD